jgi:cytidine deaminase
MARRIPWDTLFRAASEVRHHAYAPYSELKIGAAVMTRDGGIFSGCNVENSSYGLSVCAERAALFRAVAEGGQEIVAVAISADTAAPVPPCGMCRQVMAEFAGPGLQVRTRNLKGREQRYRLSNLLPHSFSGRFLKKRG